MKTLFVVALLLFANTTLADNNSETENCGIYSTWVNAIIMKKVYGVPEEQVLPELQKEQPENINPRFAIVLRDITTAVYSDKMPPIQTGADIAAVVSLFYDACMENVK